jgi:hypothetical protein
MGIRIERMELPGIESGLVEAGRPQADASMRRPRIMEGDGWTRSKSGPAG